MELHIHIAFQRGGKFPCPQDHCGKSFPAYDTAPRTWRHLNFFQYKTYIHADLPRIRCEKQFHVIKHANEAVDKVRKMEAKENVLLKNSKYLWLKNDANLAEKQQEKKETLQKKHLKTARACAMRIELQEIYEQSVHRDEAEQRLKKLCSWMMHARLEPMKKFCGTIRNHWDEILYYFEPPLYERHSGRDEQHHTKHQASRTRVQE